MTYKQLRDRVLQILDRYSVAGTRVPASYSNQEDYLNRIPGLFNDAITEISTTARKIPAVLTLSAAEGEALGSVARFSLPADFYQFRTGDTFLVAEDGTQLHTNVYGLQGRKYMTVPAAELGEAGALTVTYYRYPTLLPEKPETTAELDGLPEVQDAAAFYVAAFLAIHDDPFLYQALYNKYEDKLDKMGPGVSVEMQQTGVGFGGCCGPWMGVYEV